MNELENLINECEEEKQELKKGESIESRISYQTHIKERLKVLDYILPKLKKIQKDHEALETKNLHLQEVFNNAMKDFVSKEELRELLKKFNKNAEKFSVSFDEDLYHAKDVDNLLADLGEIINE